MGNIIAMLAAKSCIYYSVYTYDTEYLISAVTVLSLLLLKIWQPDIYMIWPAKSFNTMLGT